MAKFLSTTGAVAEIENLIKSANERLILVSPYLRLSEGFKKLLTYRSKMNRKTTVIFRKKDLKEEEMNFLNSLKLITLKSHEHLHAKCYLNDNKMIITSLNLYEFSMVNNMEMGVLIDSNDDNDKSLFEDAYKEIEYIEEHSTQVFDYNSNNTPPLEKSKSYIPDKRDFKNKAYKKKSRNRKEEFGYCIRTGQKISFNHEKPLSHGAFLSWSNYEDVLYEEKYCHFSGEKSFGETSLRYPILKKNWKKAKRVFALA